MAATAMKILRYAWTSPDQGQPQNVGRPLP